MGFDFRWLWHKFLCLRRQGKERLEVEVDSTSTHSFCERYLEVCYLTSTVINKSHGEGKTNRTRDTGYDENKRSVVTDGQTQGPPSWGGIKPKTEGWWHCLKRRARERGHRLREAGGVGTSLVKGWSVLKIEVINQFLWLLLLIWLRFIAQLLKIKTNFQWVGYNLKSDHFDITNPRYQNILFNLFL